MKTPLALAIVAISWMAGATPAVAQVSAEVTVKLPIELSQFGADIPKIKVECTLFSDAITNGTGGGNHYLLKVQEYPMSGGRFSETATIVYSLTQLDNPTGKTANLNCAVFGWNPTGQTWNLFASNQTNPSFKTTTNVSPGIGTVFTW